MTALASELGQESLEFEALFTDSHYYLNFADEPGMVQLSELLSDRILGLGTASQDLVLTEDGYSLPYHAVFRTHWKHLCDISAIPDWLERGHSEWTWYNKNSWDNTGHLSWLLDSTVIVDGTFCVSMNDQLSDIFGPCYDPHLDRWFLTDAEGHPSLDSLEAIFQEYGVQLSPRTARLFAGIINVPDVLRSQHAEALEAGLRVPDMWPTERSYKEHQQQAVTIMAQRQSYLCADQVGLGKSGEFIGAALSRIQWMVENTEMAEEDLYPILIITPKSTQDEFAEEILKWKNDAVVEKVTSSASHTVVDENGEVLEWVNPFQPDTQFIVIRGTSILDARKYDLAAANPFAIVVDEAEMMKRLSTKRTQALMYLRSIQLQNRSYEDGTFYGMTILGTGTPFSGTPAELWGLLTILGQEEMFGQYAIDHLPESEKMQKVMVGRAAVARGQKGAKRSVKRVPIWGERAFLLYFCGATVDHYGDVMLHKATHKSELHSLLTNNVMIRRRKQDVMNMDDLPLKQEVHTFVLNPEDRAQYDVLEEEFVRHSLELARIEAAERGITEQEAVREVEKKLFSAEHGMQHAAMVQHLAAVKVEETIAWIEDFFTNADNEGQKLLVFGIRRVLLNALSEDPRLEKYGRVAMLAGGDHQTPKKRFQKDPDCRLMICYSGARAGHTLTAAWHGLIAETPYMPDWTVQMAGRFWARYSEEYEPHEATLHYLVAEDTVDAHILLQARNRKMDFDAIMDNETHDDVGSEEEAPANSEVLISLLKARKAEIRIA